ncbi:MAG: asparaginase [Bacteroidia bacterium]
MKSKVFILYTGGTFGMQESEDKGLVPRDWDEILKFMPAVNNDGYFSHFKNVEFTFDTLDEIVDSSDITPDTWKQIAAKIAENYEDHSGFIVIHGTDTLAYTASALSFVLEDLDKPVILTGSQLPVFHPRTDAITNLSNAIYIAAYDSFELECIPEVCICFNDDLLRGNRSSKSSTLDLEGFQSPNHPNLGQLEQDISIESSLLRPQNKSGLKVKSEFSDRVVNVTVFPGYNPAVLIMMVEEGLLQGIVLKTFGSGNLSNHPGWTQLVKACEENEVLILATTQCLNGSIKLGKYKASEQLISENVISGFDITSEAALTKLMWVIGNYPMAERKAVLSQNIRGEMSPL